MKRASAPGYDLFKLIVALILLAILLLMLLRGCATNPVPVATTETVVSTTTKTPTSSPVPPTHEPTSTPAAIQPRATTTAVSTVSPTAIPTTPTETASVSCNTSVPSRLNVGQKAKVVRNLNMRIEPGIDAQLIQTNLAGTQLEIIGGPVCTPRGERAYLWWQVSTNTGTDGWSAENALNEPTYFLEPIP